MKKPSVLTRAGRFICDHGPEIAAGLYLAAGLIEGFTGRKASAARPVRRTLARIFPRKEIPRS